MDVQPAHATPQLAQRVADPLREARRPRLHRACDQQLGLPHQIVFGGIELADAREQDLALGDRPEARDAAAQGVPTSPREHRERHTVEESASGRLRRVEIAVRVEPQDAGILELGIARLAVTDGEDATARDE
jgi:hypothetical protein